MTKLKLEFVYKFVSFNVVIPFCPVAPVAPVAPVEPGTEPCGPMDLQLHLLVLVDPEFLFYYLSFLSSLSNLIDLQNSTEPTKKPSNGPVLHSYFLSSVGYWL